MIKQLRALFSAKPKAFINEAARPTKARTRFRVQRIHAGTLYEAYAGDDGALAVDVWEAYKDSDPFEYPGELRFVDDEHGVRGRVTRNVPEATGSTG